MGRLHPLITSPSPPTTHHLPLIAHHSSPAPHRPPLVTHHSSPTTRHPPLATHHSSPTTCHPPLVRWVLSLDPHFLWGTYTHHAPGRSILPQETLVAHAHYVAALQTTQPEDGRSIDDWIQLYVYSISVLPLFDPSSIPAHLIIDRRGRCFLVRALAHPDDRVARAAAHALQRIVIGHMALRVPLFKSMLALLGRIPEQDVAVRATTLAHFGQLLLTWIDELHTIDPFKLTAAPMLEPLEP